MLLNALFWELIASYLPGGSNIDTFRIKIWTEDEFGNESVVYDNLVMEDPPDDEDPQTELGGGNIKIHKG